MVEAASLCQELDIALSERDVERIECELSGHVSLLRHYLMTVPEIPSHIPGTSSVCVPITSLTDPDELFRRAEGTVNSERFQVTEYEHYRVTVHYSTVPVVILLPKVSYAPRPNLQALSDKCSDLIGARVGGDTGVYLQYNQPRFWWALQTDDEYEGVASRVHLPLLTNADNLLAWAEHVEATEENWIAVRRLERGKIYRLRTDIPHTALNRHPTDGRLHLILDVHE
jgi:hypothetical protein